MTDQTRWTFGCPVHGDEVEVFCFRAFDLSLWDRWRKVHKIEGLCHLIPHTKADVKRLLRRMQ
jgi:hypothetical protein